MKLENKNYNLIFWFGIILFPIFIISDFILYPEMKIKMFVIRLLVTLYLIIARRIVVNSSKENISYNLMNVSILIAATGNSVICFLSGEGFACPYNAGLWLVITGSSALINVSTGRYLLVALTSTFQHFVMLSFDSWILNDFTSNLFFTGSFIFISLLIHRYIYMLISEIKTLKNFLPICMYCKKIRDDRGYWNQVDKYVSDHADISFTHGICPECGEKIEKQLDEYDKYPGSAPSMM